MMPYILIRRYVLVVLLACKFRVLCMWTRRDTAQKRCYLSTELHGIMSKKTVSIAPTSYEIRYNRRCTSALAK